MSTGHLKVEVWRGDAESGAYQAFDVPQHTSQTVLDVVSWIQQHLDGTLSYRFACRVGMCGSCAMTVNGTPRWTCRTHVDRVQKNGTLRIGPLRNLPVIKDLAVDMDPFFEAWSQVGFEGTADRSQDVAAIAPDDPDRVAASAGIECINCAVCYAACDTVQGNRDYLGPAALNRAWTLVKDAKHADTGAVLDQVSEAGGCFNCHGIGSCSELCPNGLDPMGAIAGLKRAASRRAWGRR